MLALRLFLPETWTSKRAGWSERVFRRNINGTDEAGDSPGGDRSYHRGRCSLRLRAGGRRLWAERAVPPGAGGSQADVGGRYSAALKVYPADVRMIRPVAKRGRPRKRSSQTSYRYRPKNAGQFEMAHHQLAHRHEGKLKARFAAVRVRVADGPPRWIRDKGHQHLPGDEAWLIGEHRMSGRKIYDLANLPAKMSFAPYRPYEGAMDLRAGSPAAERRTRSRSLRGPILEGPAWSSLMTMIAGFPPASPARDGQAERKNHRPTTSTDLTSRAPAILDFIPRLRPQRCPHCRKFICNEQRRE